jgi:TolB-like protein
MKLQLITIQRKTGLQFLCQLLLLSALFAASACSRRYDDMPAYTSIPWKEYENQGVGRFKSSYLSDQIDRYYRGINPGPIGITTFVNLDDLYNTSSFGRMYAEQVMSELAMKGYDVVEIRHADALQFLSNTGEFALSRDIGMVRKERDLGGLIVGTYTVSPIRVYVNARLIDPATSLVVSAGSVEMTKTEEIAKLVKSGNVSPSLERIPVRHLGMQAVPWYQNPTQQGMLYDLEERAAAQAPYGSAMMKPNTAAPQLPLQAAPQSDPAPQLKEAPPVQDTATPETSEH